MPEAEASPGGAIESGYGPPSGVEVLRVRGRGIQAIETDVPASVTAFDAATIEALGAQDVSDLSRVTPNVTILQPNATQSAFFVRGIGLSDFQSNATSAVSIFQDGVSLNAPALQSGQLYDIDNVEIVKGPQGTGHYRNASAGAIRIRSRLPSGNISSSLRTSLGLWSADGGKGAARGLIQDYEGAVEAPILDDVLSTRFAFRYREADPYKRNGCGNALQAARREVSARLRFRPGDQSGSICGELGGEMLPPRQISRIPEGLPGHIQDEFNWAARGTLSLRIPDSDTRFILSARGSRLDQDPSVGQVTGSFRVNESNLQEAPFTFGGFASSLYQEPDQAREFREICQYVTNPDTGQQECSSPGAANRLAKQLAERPLDQKPYRGDYNRHGRVTRDTWGLHATIDTKWRNLEIAVLASYDAYERSQDIDLDFSSDILFEQDDSDESWQTYEELRLMGELPWAPFEWEVGGYFLYEQLDVRAELIQGQPDSRVFPAVLRDYSQQTTSFALWGSFAWDLYDDLTLEGGVRYNWERKDFDIARSDLSVIAPSPPALSGDSTTWQTPTGEIALRYHFNAYVSSYLKYARGFKVGHYNAFPGRTQIAAAPADDELNDAWEIGLGGIWLDGRVAASAALFYYRYQNYQLFIFRDDPVNPPILQIVNAKEAENYGIELEGRIEPLRGLVPRMFEGLRISGNFSWLHGEFIDFQLVEPEAFPGGLIIPIVNDFSGNQLQNSPEFTVSGTVDWTFDLGRFGFVTPRWDVSWSDDIFFNPREGRGLTNPDGSQRLPEFAVGQPALFLHGLRVSYRTPSTNVEVAFWMRNVFDEVYKTFAADVSKFRGVVVNFVGEPRTMGMDLVVSF